MKKIALILSILGIGKMGFAQWTTSSAGYIYYNSGSVAIGTATSSGNPLNVQGDASGNAIAYFNSLNTIAGYGVAINTEANNPSTYAIHAFRSGNQANSLFWLGTSGNVGIGTPTPGHKLTVSGNIASNATASNAIYDGNWGPANFIGSNGVWALRTSTNGSYNLDVYNNGSPIAAYTVLQNGSIGIGTTDPQGYKLAVNGNVIAESVKVKVHSSWPDYIFDKSHSLSGLDALERYVRANEHLPGIPSAKEIKKEGLDLGEMNAKLLQKIEELTLYVIEQHKRADRQDQLIATQQKEINLLKKSKR